MLAWSRRSNRTKFKRCATCRKLENSIKSNFHAGGTAVKTSLTKKEKFICQKIKNFLINKKLYFVGIDIIDGFLTEINITSPTGIQEINQLDDVRIEKTIINFVLKSLK